MPKPVKMMQEMKRRSGPGCIMVRDDKRGMVPADGKFDHAYNTFLRVLDPRGDSPESAAIRHALACSTDLRFVEFGKRIMQRDSRGHRQPCLATVAKQCAISLSEFDAWADKSSAQWATSIAHRASPRIMSDMVKAAQTRKEPCSRCDGTGEIELNKKPRTCPLCKGAGEVDKIGDAHSQDKVLETAGVVGKKSGASVKLVQNFGTIESATDRLNKVTFEVASSETKVASSETKEEPDAAN